MSLYEEKKQSREIEKHSQPFFNEFYKNKGFTYTRYVDDSIEQFEGIDCTIELKGMKYNVDEKCTGESKNKAHAYMFEICAKDTIGVWHVGWLVEDNKTDIFNICLTNNKFEDLDFYLLPKEKLNEWICTEVGDIKEFAKYFQSLRRMYKIPIRKNQFEEIFAEGIVFNNKKYRMRRKSNSKDILLSPMNNNYPFQYQLVFNKGKYECGYVLQIGECVLKELSIV